MRRGNWSGTPCRIRKSSKGGCSGQLATLELTEHGNTTKLVLSLAYATKEARDGALQSGMEHGVNACYQRLDEILGATKAQAETV